jgi:hypothetical protein
MKILNKVIFSATIFALANAVERLSLKPLSLIKQNDDQELDDSIFFEEKVNDSISKNKANDKVIDQNDQEADDSIFFEEKVNSINKNKPNDKVIDDFKKSYSFTIFSKYLNLKEVTLFKDATKKFRKNLTQELESKIEEVKNLINDKNWDIILKDYCIIEYNDKKRDAISKDYPIIEYSEVHNDLELLKELKAKDSAWLYLVNLLIKYSKKRCL